METEYLEMRRAIAKHARAKKFGDETLALEARREIGFAKAAVLRRRADRLEAEADALVAGARQET